MNNEINIVVNINKTNLNIWKYDALSSESVSNFEDLKKICGAIVVLDINRIIEIISPNDHNITLWDKSIELYIFEKKYKINKEVNPLNKEIKNW